MKHFRLARLLPCLLISLCPPLLGHCGGALEHGTETGNPPVVEQQKLHVVLQEEGVVVVGDPGAVSPGASVAVTNTRTGARSVASAGSDGSVRVSVLGTLDDEYELTVSSGGRSQTVRVSANAGAGVGGGASGAGGTSAGGELASASCDSLLQSLSEQVAAGYAGASTACQADSDCTMAGDVGCNYTCGGPILSVAGALAAEQAILEDTAPVCSELTRRCGPRGPAGCPLTLVTLGCVSGSCQALSCEALHARLNLRLTDILNADRDCAVDADCTLISASVRCIADCGNNFQSVPTSMGSRLTQQIQSAESSICNELEMRGCPGPIALPCVPLPPSTNRAVCFANRCQVESVPLP